MSEAPVPQPNQPISQPVAQPGYTAPLPPIQPAPEAKKPVNFVLIILIVLAAFAIGVAAFWYFTTKLTPKSPAPTPTPIPTVVPTPSPLPSLEATPSGSPKASASPKVQGKTDLELISQAFADKYDRPVSEVKVTISKQQTPYVSGGVTFGAETGGGWFLAYKKSGSWIIVADGNGTVPCEAIEPYDFPVSMVPECWDEATSKLITR